MFKLVYIFLITFVYCKIKYPTIAILSNPNPDNSDDLKSSKINAYYVRWLEAAGAKVIPIHPWNNQEELDTILSKVNGVLFQGGSRDLKLNSPYEKIAKSILNKIIELKDKQNIILPLWATCLGFELVHSILINKVDLDTFDSYNKPSPLFFNGKDSRMFNLLTDNDYIVAQNKEITPEFHHFGISEEKYELYPEFKNFFRITSTAYDSSQKFYIASVEGKQYPIYAVQFHPEKIAFDRNAKDLIPENSVAIRISQHLGNFFISESRENDNFMTSEELTKYGVLDSYSRLPEVIEDGTFVYIFNREGLVVLE